jgi:hypothetical protein
VPRSPSPTTVVYEEEATIAAPVDVIWNTLVDLPGYASWNPWVVQAKGEVTPGASVGVQVVMGPIQQHADHFVMTVDAERSFCWRDAGWNSWFVYGQRCRWLTPQPDGTVHFKQQLLLDGALDHFADATNGPCLRSGMAAETAALKATAEARAAAH